MTLTLLSISGIRPAQTCKMSCGKKTIEEFRLELNARWFHGRREMARAALLLVLLYLYEYLRTESIGPDQQRNRSV